ncbi:hypothetical protein L1987_48349 [Smallanthus sonchifolius]|uniref:Uncharacterized protein n=1 Tax=Smallanthus sonchifolius TaxID=185202 RepID=A0ACB9FR35_9ASTR|nr:hypothetical protein L1987_48349 [Smallanthus sonchifolius]
MVCVSGRQSRPLYGAVAVPLLSTNIHRNSVEDPWENQARYAFSSGDKVKDCSCSAVNMGRKRFSRRMIAR